MTVPVNKMTFNNREMIYVYLPLTVSEEEDKHWVHVDVHPFSLSNSRMTQVLVK